MNDEEAKAALHRSLDAGVNMIDTADIYGDGHSEKLIREVLEERRKDGKTERVFVFTKAGRGQAPHGPQNYTVEALRESINGSRERLGKVGAMNIRIDWVTIPMFFGRCRHENPGPGAVALPSS